VPLNEYWQHFDLRHGHICAIHPQELSIPGQQPPIASLVLARRSFVPCAPPGQTPGLFPLPFPWFSRFIVLAYLHYLNQRNSTRLFADLTNSCLARVIFASDRSKLYWA
jgi:hypothetical protein